MPPASNPVSVPSKFKSSRFSTSPDSEPTLPEPDITPVSSKKKKKNAASKQTQNTSYNDRVAAVEITKRDPSPARPQTILSQIPHSFALPSRRDSPLLDIQDDDTATTEKVSDQYTPPDDTWLEQDTYQKSRTPVEQVAPPSNTLPQHIEPGFSTRLRYESRSPPVSPPVRYARPVSYSGVPPMPAFPRGSPSGYTYASGAYGSPPAPHMPQPHFYHAQDVNLGLPRSNMPPYREEPSLIKHTKLPSELGGSKHGVLLGYDGRLNVLSFEGNAIVEVGAIERLSGVVLDAVVLDWKAGSEISASSTPLIALIVHGPRASHEVQNTGGLPDDTRSTAHRPTSMQNIEYTTRVEILSVSEQRRLAVLLETPSQLPQGAFRGAPPTTPSPIGQLKLQSSGSYLTVSSGVSGEIYVFTTAIDTSPGFVCICKLWTAVKPQTQRRDSTHHPPSDADVSPADIARAGTSEQAILSINGRWLATSPANSSSRPSIGAVIGPEVLCNRNSRIEMTSPPARPPITCEVDSPDADTLFGKVARGVAQELVKGAKWLGDQGYQTWQSYWRKEQSPAQSPSPVYSPPTLPTYAPNSFPPTHGEAQRNPKEPELVAIYDLEAFQDMSTRKGSEEIKPLATFQPPRGCSFISFATHGLNLLTAGRKGDVQYVWDLMQIKHCRTHIMSAEDDGTRTQPRVRQIAKYERLSGSTIVDIIWDSPNGARFAVLTKNKTIHLFDLPASAFRWPPPRNTSKLRPASSRVDSVQQDTTVPTGFFASAMNIANQAQPMIANWRGRAPSMSGGLAGIGQTGIGLASATGARGSKAVAAGLSKSLGAASETVNQIRHAGESRLHLKSNKEVLFGRTFWVQRGSRSILCLLESDTIRQYQIHRNKNYDKREDVTVFAARKAVNVKYPDTTVLVPDDPATQDITAQNSLVGFWKPKASNTPHPTLLAHPLSFAEIETNAPYQPFHSDRRVMLSVYSHSITTTEEKPRSKSKPQGQDKRWVFGDDIPSITLNISKIQIPDDENDYSGSVIYRETVKVASHTPGEEGMDQIVSTTRRRKVKKSQSTSQTVGSDNEKEDGFFEDDCDVLDFATDRV